MYFPWPEYTVYTDQETAGKCISKGDFGNNQRLDTKVLMYTLSSLSNLVLFNSGKLTEIALFYSSKLYLTGLV